MRTSFFTAAVLASGLATAATPIDGWYSSVFGGYSYLPDNISHTYQGNVFTYGAYNNGYHAGGRVGYQSNPLRYEGEITYIHASSDGLFVNGVNRRDTNGQISNTLAMANVYYDFPEMVPCLAPFAGVGLGYGWVEASMSARTPVGWVNFKGSDSVFAYQATAGFTFNFAENYALNIAYRYVGTDRVDEIGKVFQANLASVGAIYRFDEGNYK